MQIGAYLVAGFLLGGIPFAYIFGRSRGVDIRRVGSGNVGATNLTRALGLRWGIVAFIADASKGVLPVLGAREFFPELAWLPALSGAVAVLGHCYTPFLGFRGGKGVATGAGVVAALHPLLFLMLALVWGGSLWAIANVGIASSVTALGAGALGVALFVAAVNGHSFCGAEARAIATMLLTVASIVILRHRKNISSFISAPRPGSKA